MAPALQQAADIRADAEVAHAADIDYDVQGRASLAVVSG